MEFLIAGGIAAAGWALSTRGVESRRPPPPPTLKPHRADAGGDASGTTTSMTSRELIKEYDDAAKARWEAAQNPQHTGIIAPFFSSARKQHTNNALKQRRMEIYTGNDPTWRPKQETEARFQPTPQNITSSGSAGNAVNYDTTRQTASVSGTQNNVLPFEQVRVGPGVGVDSSVAATDGFHSMYRTMPVDATGYRTNTLEGRIIPGGAQVTAREVDPQLTSKMPPRFWGIERRPLAKGRATVTARTHRPKIVRVEDRTCHVVGDEYFGGAGRAGQNVPAGGTDRHKNDVRPGLPLTNVKGGDGLGGFSVASFDTARFTNQQREMDGTNGALTGYGYGPRAQTQYLTPNTKRDLSSCQGYMGGAGHAVPTGTTQPLDLPLTTLREQLHDQSNGCAPAAPVLTGTRVQCTNKQLLRESKRGSQVVNTYIPGAQRTAEYARANLGFSQLPRYVVNHENLRQKCDARDCRVTSHAQSSAIYWNEAAPGESSTRDRQRLPEANMYQDYSLAKTALKGNELAVHIN